MKILDLRTVLSDHCNDVTFELNGVKCGVVSEVHEGVPKFQAWCGQDVKEYCKIDDLLIDKFFNGHSLIQLSTRTDFTFI